MDDFNLLFDLRRPYRRDPGEDVHPHANFRAEVAAHTLQDPLATLENLSRDTGIPIGSLIRYVLSRWASSGAEAVLAMGPIVLAQMEEIVETAEASAVPGARLEGFEKLAAIVRWLRAGISMPNWQVS